MSYKLLSLALLALCATVTSFTTPTEEYVEVEVVNPCTRDVNYGYNSHTLKPEVNVDNYGSVRAGQSRKFNVPKGAYLKFERKGQSVTTMLGRADYKGQRFTVDCQ